jgi:hypothetical protein
MQTMLGYKLESANLKIAHCAQASIVIHVSGRHEQKREQPTKNQIKTVLDSELRAHHFDVCVLIGGSKN